MDDPAADRWTQLTWDELEAWAGSAVVGRGRGYHRAGQVLGVARQSDGSLLGVVEGSEVYQAWVRWQETDLDQPIHSGCTCPYGWACKHAVAVVIRYAEMVESDEEVPERLPDSLLARLPRAAGAPFGGLEPGAAGTAAAESVADYLDGLGREELAALLLELSVAHPAVHEALRLRAAAASGDVAQLVAAVRAEIAQASAEPGWSRHWSGESFTPDYSRVRDGLEALLAAGHADAVLELGGEVLERGTSQAEVSEDEGETAAAISDCLTPVWEALARSSLGPAQGILWLMDRLPDDEWDLCDGCTESPAWEAGPEVWSEVADVLLGRIRNLEEEHGETGSGLRAWLLGQAVEALDRAGRHEEATDLAITAVGEMGAEGPVVARLVAAGRLAEARELATRAAARCQVEAPYAVPSLLGHLREIAERQGDRPLAAAIVLDGFWRQPTAQEYHAVREVVEALGCWPQVRDAIVQALETGRLPDPQAGWPLPPSGLPPLKEPFAANATRWALLVGIGTEEGNHREVLRWYRKLTQAQPYGWEDLGLGVARTIAPTYPDESLSIWRKLAEQAIAGGNRAAYERSLQYLRPMRDLLVRLDRQRDWDGYLAELRRANSRRRALLETLDRLTPRRIGDG